MTMNLYVLYTDIVTFRLKKTYLKKVVSKKLINAHYRHH